MRSIKLCVAMTALVLVAGILTGCDNRSQLEKDADKAVSDVKKAIK